MNSGIYCIFNTVNWKRYIGQSRSLKTRWKSHLCGLRHGKHANVHLQSAFSFYGEKSFLFQVLEYVETPDLNRREIDWISFFDTLANRSGYNLDFGGKSKGAVSQETRKKLSLSHLGKKIGPHSEEWKKRISESNLKTWESKELRKKQSDLNIGKYRQPIIFGRHPSETTKTKISKSLTGKKRGPMPEELKHKLAQIFKGRRPHEWSEESRIKLSSTMTGRKTAPFSKKHKASLKAAWIIRKQKCLTNQ